MVCECHRIQSTTTTVFFFLHLFFVLFAVLCFSLRSVVLCCSLLGSYSFKMETRVDGLLVRAPLRECPCLCLAACRNGVPAMRAPVPFFFSPRLFRFVCASLVLVRKREREREREPRFVFFAARTKKVFFSFLTRILMRAVQAGRGQSREPNTHTHTHTHTHTQAKSHNTYHTGRQDAYRQTSRLARNPTTDHGAG